MRIVIFFLIILVVAFYIAGQIQDVKNKYVIMYSSWAVGLIFSNFLIGMFLYAFRHSVINSGGQPGLKGKMGRRGVEGPSDFCNFCLPKSELDNRNKFIIQDSTLHTNSNTQSLPSHS